MPPRKPWTSASAATRKSSHKRPRNRGLNAYAIAEQENPEKTSIRRHRLGEAEDDTLGSKRRRIDDEDSFNEDNSDALPTKRRKSSTSRYNDEDGIDISSGSDSEGHKWRYGQVDDGDDSEIDSDEAFGSSDEERFGGFVFRGSKSSKKGVGRKKHAILDAKRNREISLDEENEMGDEDDDSLGEDAIDLATALDQYESEEEAIVSSQSKSKDAQSLDGDDIFGDDEESGDESSGSAYSLSENEEDDDPDKMEEFRDFLQSLRTEDKLQRKLRTVEAHESAAPSDFIHTRTHDDFDPSAVLADRRLKKQLKALQGDAKPSKRNGLATKVEAPLPKRQKDRLGRIAANKQANETLERWVETVKLNRRADHISFPMKHPDNSAPMGEKRLLPTAEIAPLNDLESTIHNILQESGLVPANGKSDEDQIRKYEELQAKKMSLEEVRRRTAELRNQRDLLFREEIKAKRIKKIKSKAYRRVHRKEQEKAALLEREALKATGIDISEDEKEINDRRRAEERMGAKHRASRWAKGVKKAGKAAWDEEARMGVHEMARRDEELRRRMEGKDVRDSEDEPGSDITSQGSDDDSDDGTQRLQRQLQRIDSYGPDHGGESKLSSLAFMRRADAVRKAQNDATIERMRRDLAGEETASGAEDEGADPPSLGRKIFAPHAQKPPQSRHNEQRNEFEERDESNDGSGTEAEKSDLGDPAASPIRKPPSTSKVSHILGIQKSRKPAANGVASTKQNRIASQTPKDRSKNGVPHKTTNSQHQSITNGIPEKATGAESAAAADDDGWITVTYNNQNTADDNESGEEVLPFVLRNQDLVRKAFAGDEVADEFEERKKAVIEEEAEKVIDNTLPGWGSWTGEGLTKRQKRHNKSRILTKQEGIKPEKRKDVKLERVIVRSERRNKKNAKYLASALPHTFESATAYNLSIRMPLGPEFLTKRSHQEFVKPRVLLKQGIIAPLEKPLL